MSDTASGKDAELPAVEEKLSVTGGTGIETQRVDA